MHRRVGEIATVGAVALAGYAGGLISGLVATATLEPAAGMSLVGVLVQTIAALSSVVAVALVGRVSQRSLRAAALVTVSVATVLYLVLVAAVGHALAAVALHAIVVAGLVTLLLHRDVSAWRDRPHHVAGTH